MSNYEIEGNLLDSFNMGFAVDTVAINPGDIAPIIAHELETRLAVCNKLKTNYALYVLIMELGATQNAVSDAVTQEEIAA